MMPVKVLLVLLCALSAAACRNTPVSESGIPARDGDAEEMAELGRDLFFDVNLSQNRTQSCASCHDPLRAFTDGRDNGVNAAVSLGDDGISLGDRNAPTLAYASFSPDFGRDGDGEYRGGQFHDGRAGTLVEQAGLPILNPIEMGMPDKGALARRIRENPEYVRHFTGLFGPAVFDRAESVFAAVGESIAAFERTDLFAPFDSKYDRSLRGEYVMDARESRGRDLFFSSLTSCSGCHMLRVSSSDPRETFTDYRYQNIGVPENAMVRARNGMKEDYADPGLSGNPSVRDDAQAGKYKVPTLRNIAVTAPYMHNGIFRDLRTALRFYSKYTVRNPFTDLNPETGAPWDEPEFAATVSLKKLQQGQPLDETRIDDLVAFLELLTDRRYEKLLE